MPTITVNDPILTPARLATLQRLASTNHPWLAQMGSMADWNPRSTADNGLWSLVAWFGTGDAKRLQEAIERTSQAFPYQPYDRNVTRQDTVLWPWVYGQLRDHLTPEQRTEWVGKLYHW